MLTTSERAKRGFEVTVVSEVLAGILRLRQVLDTHQSGFVKRIGPLNGRRRHASLFAKPSAGSV